MELQRDEPTIAWSIPGDAISLAERILDAVENPSKMSLLAQAAQSMIQQYHDVASTTRRIESLLSTAIQSSRSL